MVLIAGLLAACGSQRSEAEGDTTQAGSATVVSTAPATTQPVKAPTDQQPVLVPSHLTGGKQGSKPNPKLYYAGFDHAAYMADPKAYLSQVVGGRCWEVANPSPDVEILAPKGPTGFSAPTNGEVELVAATDPGMPVTFTSFGLGEFPATGLQSASVAADADGLARAVFRITPGTVGSCVITAGSPARAGTIQFLIAVTEDKP